MTTVGLAEPSKGSFPLPLDPPLVHLTTADLGNYADRKEGYDLPRLAELLDELGAVVLVTPEHLMEWVPLPADWRDRRFSLADTLPLTFVNWRSDEIWQSTVSQRTMNLVGQAGLRSQFFDEAGGVRTALIDRRRNERRIGEAEFFSRTSSLSRGGEATGFVRFVQRRVQKFQKLNGKHGSDVVPHWDRARRGASVLEYVAPMVGRLVPGAAKTAIRQAARRIPARLNRAERRMEARHHGVAPENLGFQLWWETWQKLRAKPSEVGGLAERIDLHELRLWPVCAVLTLDKRIHNAVIEALRSFGISADSAVASRFVKAGSAKRITSALTRLVRVRGTATDTGRSCEDIQA